MSKRKIKSKEPNGLIFFWLLLGIGIFAFIIFFGALLPAMYLYIGYILGLVLFSLVVIDGIRRKNKFNYKKERGKGAKWFPYIVPFVIVGLIFYSLLIKSIGSEAYLAIIIGSLAAWSTFFGIYSLFRVYVLKQSFYINEGQRKLAKEQVQAFNQALNPNLDRYVPTIIMISIAFFGFLILLALLY